MAANGISTLATKRERQDAKLALANADRAARNVVEPGRYADTTADATQLPTRYAVGDNNTNNVVDNPNSDGLLLGRPWNAAAGADANPGVLLDGSTMLYRDSALTGQADTTQMLIYYRVKRTGTMSTQFIWDYAGDPLGTNVQHYHYGHSSGFLFTRLADSTGTPIETMAESGAAANDDTYRNYLMSFDSTSGTQLSRLYVDDVLADTEALGLNDEVDFATGPSFFWGLLGRRRSGSNSGQWEGAISHFYMRTAGTLDLTVESNRRLFYDADGVPTDLSSAPSPIIQFTGNAAAWNAGTNEGTGGNFSVDGTFTDA